MEFLTDYGLFLAKSVTIVAAIAILFGLIFSISHRARAHERGHLEVTRLNDLFEGTEAALRDAVLDPEVRKREQKLQAKRKKAEARELKKTLKKVADDAVPETRSVVYVLEFDGDIKASAVDHLREEISCVLSLAGPKDEVLLKLESSGGMVHSYGLAASQLDRVRKRGIPLTVCVDKVAASGGYMMACVADRILAAPFAVIGSIGVVAQLPNFHKLLKHNHIDVELLTAGEYKRTLTMFGENTEKDREKFREDLEDTHELFKSYIAEHRAMVDLVDVANGDVWFGRRALDKKLVDELLTSDEYIHDRARHADVYSIEYVLKKNWQEKLGLATQAALDRLLLTWLGRVQERQFPG